MPNEEIAPSVRSSKKLADLLDVRRDRSLDVVCLAQTWHDADCVAFRRLRVAGYQVVDHPRRTTAESLSSLCPASTCQQSQLSAIRQRRSSSSAPASVSVSLQPSSLSSTDQVHLIFPHFSSTSCRVFLTPSQRFKSRSTLSATLTSG